MKLNLFSWVSLATAFLLSDGADSGWAQENPKHPLLPSIFSDHMVLQQKQADRIWGWDTPGTVVTVSFAGQTVSAKAGDDGKWIVKLAPMPANATPQTLTVVGSSKREISDVLVGEVWLCSGQSNMQFKLINDWNGDIESAVGNFPNLRLITVPMVGTQELQTDFKGQWRISSPQTVRDFSAVGFFFGRYLQQILNVPVGLINNSSGGSSAESWVRRLSLEQDPRFKSLLEDATKQEAELSSEQGRAEYERKVAEWKADFDKAKAENRPPASPWPPHNFLTGNHRPGNLFAGVLFPTIGYGIKGVIWYQGEQNAEHAYEYATLFPFLIKQWRQEWGQGDFPFYWVQLPNLGAEKTAKPQESSWAELREAQTKALQLTNTGQAVIIDLGEGKDIHPRNKHDVAPRLVRWALARDYGMNIPYRSPEFKSLTIVSNKALVTFDCYGSKLRPFGVKEARGFSICGPNKVWHWATGTIVGDSQCEVWSDEVSSPIAIRYAWANNPDCNLYSNDGLPATPFRTDNFEMLTKPK